MPSTKKKPAVKAAAPKKALSPAAKPSVPAGPFAVFEAHAVSWFDSLDDAKDHAAALSAVRGAGEGPVIAGVIAGG